MASPGRPGCRRAEAPISKMRERFRYLIFRIAYGRGAMLMSTMRKHWVMFKHPHADIRFGRNVYLGPRFSVFMPDGGSFVVRDAVEFRRDFRAEIADGGRVTIGAQTVFTYSV